MCVDPSPTVFYRVSQKVSDVIPVLRLTPIATQPSAISVFLSVAKCGRICRAQTCAHSGIEPSTLARDFYRMGQKFEKKSKSRGGHSMRHFRRSYLKANKVSKSGGTRKVEHAYHFWKCADAACHKLSQCVHACRHYSLSYATQMGGERCLWQTSKSSRSLVWSWPLTFAFELLWHNRHFTEAIENGKMENAGKMPEDLHTVAYQRYQLLRRRDD